MSHSRKGIVIRWQPRPTVCHANQTASPRPKSPSPEPSEELWPTSGGETRRAEGTGIKKTPPPRRSPAGERGSGASRASEMGVRISSALTGLAFSGVARRSVDARASIAEAAPPRRGRCVS